MENIIINETLLRHALKNKQAFPRVIASKLEYNHKGIDYFSDILISGYRTKKIELWSYSPFQPVRKHVIAKIKSKDITGEYYAELCETIEHILSDTVGYIVSSRDF